MSLILQNKHGLFGSHLVGVDTDAAGELRGAGITPGGIAADAATQDAEAPDEVAAAAEQPEGDAGAETPA